MPGDIGVILAAAGSGSRFGEKKQFLLLGGKPLLLHSLETFRSAAGVGEIVVVVPADDLGGAGELARGIPEVRVVAGGARRQDSVAAGLDALGDRCRWVLVHDAARPLIRPEDVERFIAVLRKEDAAVLGYPSVDSVKQESAGFIARNLPRREIWLVQTPQGASAAALRRAIREAELQRATVTDEASMLELLKIPVALVAGSRDNIKITYSEDLPLAEHILARRKNP